MSKLSKPAVESNTSFNLVDSICSYESGDLSHDGIIELFQHLLNTGTVWHLQGSYIRTAQQLINDGEISG